MDCKQNARQLFFVEEFLTKLLTCCREYFNLVLFDFEEEQITNSILQLPIIPTYTIQQLVDHVQEEQPLMNGAQQIGTTKREITGLPSHLIIQLQRFDYNAKTGASKRTDKIPILSQLLINNTKYELYGAILHEGTDVHNAHYMSWFKHTNNLWYEANDLRDHPISHVKDPFHPTSLLHTAYILFYKQP